MADANPAENNAAALNAPAPAAPDGLRAGWSWYKKFGLAVGGPAALLAGGWYGFQHFKAAPPPAVAQSEPTAPTRSEEPGKAPATPDKEINFDLPDVKAPKMPAVPTIDIDPPPLPRGDGRTGHDAPIVAPPIPGRPGSAAATDTEAPLLVKPPTTPAADRSKPTAADLNKYTLPDTVKPAPMGDGFKAADLPEPDRTRLTGPAPLPADVTGKKEKAESTGPVITIGGMQDVVAPPPPPPGGTEKKDPPSIPKLDIDLPPPPPVPMDRKDGPPTLIVPPKDPGTAPKKDDPPTLIVPPRDPGTAPKDMTPTIPKIEIDPPMNPAKTPAISIDPPSPPMNPAKSPSISIDPPTPPMNPAKTPAISIDPSTPPAAGPMPGTAAPAKRDTFDEDWHTPRSNDTYAEISREYYKTADFAPALEAYNRDRKGAERIIRVPPTWVLEERFPNLVPKSAPLEAKPSETVIPEPAGRDPKPAGGERPEARPSGDRPAPPPAIGVSRPTNQDEYKITSPQGESIREVARKTLGNPEAWRKVWDVNPGVDPTQPIPMGTTLRLPR